MTRTIRSDHSVLIRLLGVLAIMTGTLAATSVDAEAQSRVCRQLKADLNAISANRGSSREYRRYDRAVREQSVQINRAKKLAQRSGCSFNLFSSRGGQCGRIGSSLRKMEANLSQLKRQRARYAPRQSGSTHIQNQIVRLLQRNRCNGYERPKTRQVRAEQPRKSRRRTLLEQIFGVGTYDERSGRGRYDSEPTDMGFGGTYRTLCVRKSDGYYFPISFSTRREFFTRDDEACQAMCPGEDVGLFHHRMPGEDSEQMVEFGTEQPYATKPFAFAYRKEISTEKTCRFAKAELFPIPSYNRDGTKKSSSAANQQRIGTPVFRRDPHLSPDDYDVTLTGFSYAKTERYLKNLRSPGSELLVSKKSDERSVRIVGPAFFPVQ